MKKIRDCHEVIYVYDTEEERDEHLKELENQGWNNTGQKKYDVKKSLMNPLYKPCNYMVKYE